MNRIVKTILLVNLAIIMVLILFFPQLMISPGRLIEGHRAHETDCFACHRPFQGAALCVSCHKVAEIGIKNTRGAPLAAQKTKIPFHQKLADQECASCHSDHQGVAKYRAHHRFSHDLLDPGDRGRCEACHRKPGDGLHAALTASCDQCHGMTSWRPASFAHDRLAAAERERCVTCHKAKAPNDALHRQVSESCGQCHGTDKWRPATFDHEKKFQLDSDHNAKCVVCHPGNDYKKYTCYGCHEHSPGNIREEHFEEGIRQYDNCVACHRNANEEDAKRAWKRGGGQGWSGEGRGKRGHEEEDDD